ncbi:MAG: molybdopterin-synthase adenylyltransferase MoeB [Lautropia sp.]|nr:molybdopterin-synthase adenylyltransferase MoeB [Lautropia sp.]
MNDEQLLRYSRHILLDEISIEAQERLLGSTALVLGAGGLGSPAALYLAAAGVGRILLADGDTVDLTNLQRQILHTADRVGMAKTASARQALAALNPGVEVVPLPRLETGQETGLERGDGTPPSSLLEAVAQADVVLDCSDNFATRHALNRACVQLRKPLVSGAAIRFDGQLSVFDMRQQTSPCYHCLFPDGEDVNEVRCSQMGVFAPLTGIIGTMQAAEALKLAGNFGTPMTGRLLMLDALTMRFTDIRVPRDPDCPVCGHRH